MAEQVNISHKRGDSWGGWPEVTINLNAAPLDLTGSSILLQVRKSPTAPEVAAEWATGDGITILDPEAGQFAVEGRIIDLLAGTYVYDVELTLASGRVLTPIYGTFEILTDVSRP